MPRSGGLPRFLIEVTPYLGAQKRQADRFRLVPWNQTDTLRTSLERLP